MEPVAGDTQSAGPAGPAGARAVDASKRDAGSIIVILATDAPLLPHQCRRVAQRGALGIARAGGAGENSSGDLIIAFATGNPPFAISDEAATVPPDPGRCARSTRPG